MQICYLNYISFVMSCQYSCMLYSFQLSHII
nr:MAG TPA: hypothetical protein [Caudoviricetes sp.]